MIPQKYNSDFRKLNQDRVCIFLILTIILTSFSPQNSYGQIFTKITQGTIVNDGGDSRGCSWGDYNDDGNLDLWIANFHNQNNFLYANNGNGTFTKITSGVVVNDANSSYAASWADYDNNGTLDLFVANFFNKNNLLYSNNGDGSFTKITSGTIVNDAENSRGCSWGDYDNDGLLDLFVVNGYGNVNNSLYKNNGDGTFTKITSGDIVNDGGDSNGCNWADYDNDGDLDLLVINVSNEANFLYSNNGDGTFTKITSGDIVTDIASSNGGSWGDYDNDGDLDLFVTNGTNENNSLYNNNGDGTFTKITSGILVTDQANSFSSSWGDYDSDGDLDLFVANGGGANDEDNFLYTNNGDGTFTKITNEAIVTDGGYSIGCGSSDYDKDGDLDLFVTNVNQNNFFYTNNGNNNNWISINCVGTSFTNSSAIGSKVRILATINGNVTWQMREIFGQTGGRSQNSLNVEFGLGDATTIDSLIVEWPASDTTQIFTNIAVNQFLTINEPEVPIITNVFPDSGYQGYNVNVNITGKHTHFIDGNGTIDVWLAQGIDTIYAISFSDSNNTLLSANFNIPNNAQTGLWDFYVETETDGIIKWRRQFQILAEPAIISIDPAFVSVDVNEGDSTDVVITIFNQGTKDLDWSARIRQSNINTEDRYAESNKQGLLGHLDFQRGTDPPSFHSALEKRSSERVSEKVLFNNVSLQGSWAYGIDILNYEFLRFNLSSPQNTTTIASIGGDFFSGDFDENGNFYAIEDYTSMLMVIDTLSGTSIAIGPMANLSGHTWTGLTYDATTKTMYASSTNGSTSTLYTVNTTNGATTIIGSISIAPIIIDIAIDNAGNLYAHEISNDAIFRIDKTNATATLIGLTGFDANYAQGMDFDPATDELYLAAYNNYNYTGELRRVDLTTGLTTLIGPIGNGFNVEVDAFGISGIGKPPYLKLLPPTSGTIPPNQQTNLFARIYGIIPLTEDTTLSTNIEVTSNDPFSPSVLIPVEVTVITGINDDVNLPSEYGVSQNYPNPFNPETTIKFQLPQLSDVKLEIFNILGQKIKTLVNSKVTPGYHEISWDGHNSNGNLVSGGIYIFRFKANNYQKVRKMVLIK